MENITLGQIAIAVAFVVGLVSGASFLMNKVKDALAQMFTDQLKAINYRMDALESKITDVDMQNCKNYLVNFLSRVEKGEKMDEIETERFHEQFDRYINKGGNSYIKQKKDKLTEKGLL